MTNRDSPPYAAPVLVAKLPYLNGTITQALSGVLLVLLGTAAFLRSFGGLEPAPFAVRCCSGGAATVAL